MHNTTTNSTRKLWTFHGGIHMPDHKAQTCDAAIEPIKLPSQLILPLKQHVGSIALPVVEVGQRVLKGELIAKSTAYISAPLHAPTSGVVTEIGDAFIPHPSRLPALSITIKPDGKDEWITADPATHNPEQLTLEALATIIGDAGIVGLGGGTFPSSVKASANDIHTLILNGAECEPYITCDDRIMRERADKIINSAAIIKRVLGANECLIGIEDNKPEAIAEMQRAVSDGGHSGIEIVTIPTLYPSGGEKQLIQILTGKEVPSGSNPTQIGIVCFNVATAEAIYEAITASRPMISRIVTITGEGIKRPCNVEALLGTPINELIAQAGGYSDTAEKLIIGGPMMGFTVDTDQLPLTKGVNCLLVVSESEIPTAGPGIACIRCSECANVCPTSLLPQQMYWFSRSQNLEKSEEYNLFDCIECGCCSHVCPAEIPLVQYFRSTKTAVTENNAANAKNERARMRNEARTARLEKLDAEKREKTRLKKEAMQKKKEEAAAKAAAEGASDDSQTKEIEAAKKRVLEKKDVETNKVSKPRNTENLTAEQQQQIDQADLRRKADSADMPSATEEK
ncbi:MAG: electron transport complex subunit RsxC [Candidatus Polarisedimenticolaceae bacterium]|nr:electron transport complex subunit RsxC [Candidatus Polarisedimenticolaceae bacterium]